MAMSLALSGLRRKFLGGVWSATEVEAAGAVEGFLRAAGGHAGGQDLVLVLAAAGQVEAESPD